MDKDSKSEWDKLSFEEKNRCRGVWGEWFLKKAINKDLGAVRYGNDYSSHASFLFENIYIPKQNGGATEVDAILVCQRGVFVFEVKSWSGQAIFGEARGKEWFTAKSVNGSVKSLVIGNPFGQNAFHIRHLKRLLPPVVVENALFSLVLLIDAMPHEYGPGNWAGGHISGLHLTPDSVVEYLLGMPVIMSFKRVQEVSKILSQYSSGS